MIWWNGAVECSMCGHCQQSVVEIEDDQDEPIIPLECGHCGNMACYPIEDEDED